MPRPLLFALSLLPWALLWALEAGADRTVYKRVDAEGKVTYSDRRSGESDQRVKSWMPANPGPSTYDAAVQRAESDRVFYARLLAERRQPAPVAIYDPRGWQAAAQARPLLFDNNVLPWRGGWDPNLPLSPAPSLERNYYYDGR